MATVNRTLPGYTAVDNPEYVIPVQQGDVHNLCIDVTPTRQGVFGWWDPTANEYRCAIVPVLEDCFTDDVVPAGDVRTVWSNPGGRTSHSGVLSVIDGELLAWVAHYDTDGSPTYNGTTECFVADDVENPTSWSLRGTVQNLSSTGSYHFDDCTIAGPPTVTEEGLWLLPMLAWRIMVVDVVVDAVGLHESDDQGATWITRLAVRKSPGSSFEAGPQSTTVAYDPVLDNYLLGSHAGPGSEWWLSNAANPPVTWGTTEYPSGNIDPYFYVDDGVNVYAGRVHDGAMRLYKVIDATDASTWIDLDARGIVSDAITPEEGFQIILLWTNEITFEGIAFTAKDRIVFNSVCTNVPAPPLHIPYKDRLSHLDLDASQSPTPASLARISSEDFQNHKVIEQWIHEFMVATNSTDACYLRIPYKQHMIDLTPPLTLAAFRTSADRQFSNFKAIESWAYRVARGECGCKCVGSSPPPDRCTLRIPYKSALLDLALDIIDSESGGIVITPHSLQLAAQAEFQAYKTLEEWANRYARGECGCGG